MYYSNCMIYVFSAHICERLHEHTTHTNLSAVTIVDDRKNGFTDVDNNVFVWPLPSTDRVIPRSSASVSLEAKLFQDYVKLGSFSDNKTETRIKSSRFHSRKEREKNVYNRHKILCEQPAERPSEIFWNFRRLISTI